MRTIIARNAHQAMAESCFQLDSFGVTDEDGGKVLPIPTASTIVAPLERVALYPALEPFDALLGGARDLAEKRHDHVGFCAEALKKDPSTRVTLRPTGECDSIGVIYIQVDLDGKVMLMACSSITDVVLEYADLVYLSMVLEYVATTCRREPGALWHTSMRPSAREPMLGIVAAIGKHAPQPPNPFVDPYSAGTLTNTIPLLSIPRGRFDRELVQFFSNDTYDSVDYIDPFIQHVLAPAHRAYRLYLEDAAVPVVQRAIGEISAQDWMQACLLWVKTTTTPAPDTACTPPTE
tara:strand:- start:7051 stop:7926 length:876 start_codon:yes stop_codon:yes gene_type:complete